MVWGVLHVVSRRWMVECIHWRPFSPALLISVFFELLLFSLQPSRNTDSWPSVKRSTGCNPGIQSLCAQLGFNRTVASTVLIELRVLGKFDAQWNRGATPGMRGKGKRLAQCQHWEVRLVGPPIEWGKRVTRPQPQATSLSRKRGDECEIGRTRGPVVSTRSAYQEISRDKADSNVLPLGAR